jgi:predicted aspartyl protease
VGVRIRVRIGYGNSSADTIALVNTGYETDVPEILIPIALAERLGIWPRLPENTTIETYRTASGLMKVYRIPGARISLVIDGVEKKIVEGCFDLHNHLQYSYSLMPSTSQ